jgi:hypothetical protein
VILGQRSHITDASGAEQLTALPRVGDDCRDRCAKRDAGEANANGRLSLTTGVGHAVINRPGGALG